MINNKKYEAKCFSFHSEMLREKLGRTISRSGNSDQSAKALLSFGQ